MMDLLPLLPSMAVRDVIPHDVNAVPLVNNRYPNRISFLGVGTLRIKDGSGTQVDFTAGEIAPGTVHHMVVTQVFAAGTTVTNIKVYYS
jgi:hypothetical protein